MCDVTECTILVPTGTVRTYEAVFVFDPRRSFLFCSSCSCPLASVELQYFFCRSRLPISHDNLGLLKLLNDNENNRNAARRWRTVYRRGLPRDAASCDGIVRSQHASITQPFALECQRRKFVDARHEK